MPDQGTDTYSDNLAHSVAIVQVVKGDSSLRHVREMIVEYTEWLKNDHGVDVGSFQDLEKELGELPGRYSKEDGGCLYVLYPGESPYLVGAEIVHRASVLAAQWPRTQPPYVGPLGCVGVKRISGDGACEMKRLYIRKEYRRFGLASLLSRAAVREACARNYKTMFLDSLERLPGTVALYTGLGFNRCAAYVPNPLSDAVFMSLPLQPPPSTAV